MWSSPTDPTEPMTPFPPDPTPTAPPAPEARSADQFPSPHRSGGRGEVGAGPGHPPRKWPYILVFLLLAGLIPETIATNSTSVLKIVSSPLSLIFVALFYGTADIVIREAIIRRPLGLAGKVLLGVAFGFMNEGVVAGTWYTVKPDGYAYIAGIDFSWAVSLAVFHLLISVLLPIYLFDSVAPALVGVPLLKRRGIIFMTVVFLALCALGLFAPIARPQRLVVYLAALLLVAIALQLPPAPPRVPMREPPPGLWSLRALGFLAMLLYFVAIYLLPVIWLRLIPPPLFVWLPGLLANSALLGLVAIALLWGVGWSRRRDWSPRYALALISGALSFSVLFSFIPPLLATWEPLATVPFAAFLIILTLRARHASPLMEIPLPSAV